LLYNTYFAENLQFMPAKKTENTPVKKKKESDKIKVKHIYISDSEETRILKKHESLTIAVREKVLQVL
jgi:hypothetical protein